MVDFKMHFPWQNSNFFYLHMGAEWFCDDLWKFNYSAYLECLHCVWRDEVINAMVQISKHNKQKEPQSSIIVAVHLDTLWIKP